MILSAQEQAEMTKKSAQIATVPSNNPSQSVIIDPIRLLHLEGLNSSQKDHLYQPLLADMAGYIINSFIAQLPSDKVDHLLTKIDQVSTQPFKIISLLEESDPDFQQKKDSYISEYCQNFRLQKFISYLS